MSTQAPTPAPRLSLAQRLTALEELSAKERERNRDELQQLHEQIETLQAKLAASEELQRGARAARKKLRGKVKAFAIELQSHGQLVDRVLAEMTELAGTIGG